MGLLSWITGSRGVRLGDGPIRRPNAPTAKLSGDGSFRVKIAGTSRRQRALEAICGGRNEDGAEQSCVAELVTEPDNPADPNAVRVEIEGYQVGYLSRDNAVLMHDAIKANGLKGRRLFCDAKIVGGWDRGGGDRGHFGVRLDLA